MNDKTEKEKRQSFKVTRQLAIFHIFSCSKVVEIGEVVSLINIIKKTSEKTILRDIKDLQKAGLINISFSKKENGYIHNDVNTPCPFLPPVFLNTKAKNRSYEKLIRLATIMLELENYTEVQQYFNKSEDKETCISWYKKRFPNLSTRTMWRDFKELKRIGYNVEYDSFEGCYAVEIPYGLEGLQADLECIYREKNIESLN